MKNRLGSASIKISVDDKNGILVRHGQDSKMILARKDAKDCTQEDWVKLWECLENLGLVRQNNY